jgi:hypothetical protein
MALMPNSAAELVKVIRDIYQDAEEAILHRLARQIAKGITSETWLDRKYADLQDLNRQLDTLLSDLERGVPGAVERAMRMAYNRGTAAAVADLEAVGRGAGALASPPVPPSIGGFVTATLAPLNSTLFRVRRWAADTYDQVTRETTAQMLTGTLTRREASAQALKRYASRGVTGFTDVSGRNWELASFAEMAARTQAAQASLQGHTDKLRDLGQDLVIVSDHLEECALCRPIEGKVLSISGRTRGTLGDGVGVWGSVAEAVAAGLYHANCRHSQGLYIMGVTKPFGRTEDPEGDALRQRQRAYERRIREWKRRVIVDEEIHGKDSEPAKVTRRKLRQAQAEFKTWRDENDRKNLAYRTSLTAR